MKKLTRREDNKALAWAKKMMAIEILGGECELCKCNDFFALEFHHKDNNKENDISSLKKGRWSVMLKEVKKCQLLCSNCHAEIHCCGSRNYIQSENKLRELGLFDKMKCEKCNYVGRNLASLCFHHLRSKDFTINDALYHKIGVPLDIVAEEISKCIILCRNCHVIEHRDLDEFDRLKPYIYHKIDTYKELRPKIDRETIWDMYVNKGMMQKDIVDHFGCSKGTISDAIKIYAYQNELELPHKRHKVVIEKKDGKIRVKRLLQVYKKECPNCNIEFSTKKEKKKYCSVKCCQLARRKVKHPPKKELEKMLEKMSYAQVAKKYGVSREAVYFWRHPEKRNGYKNKS